jgi:hypothetical protein
VRAATACACSAAAGHDDGDSAATTPATYCSRPIALTASSWPTEPGRNSSQPRYWPSRRPLAAVPRRVIGAVLVTCSGGWKVARRRFDALRRSTRPSRRARTRYTRLGCSGRLPAFVAPVNDPVRGDCSSTRTTLPPGAEPSAVPV